MAVCGLCHQQITGTDYRSYKSKKYHLPCFDELKKVADHKDKALAASSSHKEKELDSLCAYVCQLFQLDKMPKSLIRQAENIQREDGLSFAQIEKGLWWFYEIEGHAADPACPNLGIAPYAYEELESFFNRLEKSCKHNEETDLKNEVVIVKPFPGAGKRMDMFTNMNDL
jgi:hypothetical protein